MNNQNTSAVALIVGAGPAGLTAATELQRNTTIHPIVVEESDAIGGISRTVRYHGNRMDIGGHRFFSRSERVNRWWLSFLPMQGAPALDDRLLSRSKPLSPAGPDPDLTDEVMLTRDRISRIFYLRAFFDYPISLKYSTFAGMGL